MKLIEAERMIKEKLADIYPDSEASQIASLALEHITGWDRQALLFQKETLLNQEQKDQLENIVQRLA
ncbi:MAG: hypothetical protein ACXWB9_08595, partial [Flavisolibacter sp.]